MKPVKSQERGCVFKGVLPRVVSMLILSFLLALPFWSCARVASTASNPSVHPRNVILIGVDTLRADRLECYGYAAIKTPNINRLASDGVLFRNAIAQVPLTLPSFCSIMTGAYPMFHGVRDFSYGFLREESVTLAEVLKAQGYATGAVLGAFVLDARFGLNQGFDFYDGDFNSMVTSGVRRVTKERRGDRVVRAALEWLRANQEKKCFLWIHPYDPHHPYDPPEPFRSQYAANPYEGEIAFVDSLVGEILDFLESSGLYDDSLIIFTSDHGESLGEHQEPQHGFFVYDSVLRVPLIIKAPGSTPRGRTIDTQVQTIDIMPTILQYLSVRKPQEVQGIGLRSLIEGKTSNLSRPYAHAESYYALSSFGWSPLRSLRTNKYKYIQAPQPELYDLEKDPLELKNLHSRHKALANRFSTDLRRFEQRYSTTGPARQQTELDREVTERLRSLGYVAYATGIPAGAGANYDGLADPKGKVELFNLYMKYIEAEDNPEVEGQRPAIELLERLVESDPNVSIAVNALTNRYLLANRHQEALDLNQRILNGNPKSATAAFNLGRVYRMLKRTDEAIAAYRQALDLDPHKAATHHNLGIAYIEKDQYSQAIERLKEAIRLQPKQADSYLNLGLAYLLNRNQEEAITNFQQAIRIKPANAQAHEYLGRIYLQIGRTAEGQEELRLADELKRKYELAE